MTDFEKAKEISQDCYMPDTGFNREDLYDSAMEMAQWKEKKMIEKACEWLEKNCTYIHPRTGKKTCVVNLNAFKKAMEE